MEIFVLAPGSKSTEFPTAMTSILIIDRDLGFMWALAESLKVRGIAAIPSTSVEEAEAILGMLQPGLSLLIMNCACRGVCSFAQQLRKQHEFLKVIGITSRGHRCRECARFLIATLSDPEDRSKDQLEHCVELICILTSRSGLGRSWSG
jgi:NADPH:quinone reductase-like Zn-dependent oxidoreductase